MSTNTERALVLDRPCATCQHGLRHRGARRCTRDLVRAGVPAEQLRLYISSADTCCAQRRHGPLLARVLFTCGREGRYWRART